MVDSNGLAYLGLDEIPAGTAASTDLIPVLQANGLIVMVSAEALTEAVTNLNLTDLSVSNDLTMGDAGNMIFGTTTGTKIGAAAAQKIGKWGVTPIVQPAAAAQGDQGALTAAALTDNSGGTASSTLADVTEVNNSGSADRVPTENAIASLAAEIETLRVDAAAVDVLLTAIRTAMVNAGDMKGAA